MAEKNETGDEYEFSDLDGLTSVDPMGEENALGEEETYETIPSASKGLKVLRNGLIVIVSLILLLVFYSWFSSSKKYPIKDVVESKPITQIPAPPLPTPSVQVESHETTSKISGMMESLSTLTQSQENIRGDISEIGNQISQLNSNVNAVNAKISDLNQAISELSLRMASQSEALQSIVAKMNRPVHKKTVMAPHATKPQVTYFIQAAIPGRAWLIASNGTTMTVREGSNIVGYGIVKLIDPNQGRVLTSSGRVIRFSQQDS